MEKRLGSRNYVPPAARQLVSPERLKKIRSLVCLNLPTALLDRTHFRRHFSKYGKVIKMSITAAKNSAQVHYDTHESAANAKQNAAKGYPDSFKICWSEIQPRKSVDLDKPAPSRLFPSSDVQDELQSMSQQGGYLTSKRSQGSPAGPSKQARIENFFQASPPQNPSNPFAAKSDAAPSTSIFGKPNIFASKPQTGNPFQASDKPQQLFQPPDKPKPIFGLPSKSSPGPSNVETLKSSIFSGTSQFPSRNPSEPLRTRLFQTSEPKAAAAPPPPTQPPQKLVMSAENLGLLSTVKRAAHTIEDKLIVLEAKDKLFRQKMVKSSSLATAVKTVGTCPDMCPERERYLRIDRHQVSQYETRNGEPAHQFFVKQYSRSSADQEIPLPHDLRPSSTLRMTMNYLLSQITPRVEAPGEHLGEWFLFLWDRTRAIRKDITQQELCNEDAVILLEQCARFHIACAARLTEEDVHDFDPKINSENLAKCLQTLKHLYHDMSLQGKACPNEAEFRAYIVLLNLNTGDAIWEVQQLSPEILASQPVQNAIKVYLSLSTHNYVNFFKVVRTIGYLPAAILMRYYTQVRSKGLEILIRAYCQSAKSSYSFPMNDLVRLFAFEDAADATEFCQYHGLDTTAEIVLFSRMTYMKPESNITLRRAKSSVECQLTVTFAEAIAGYPMAQFNNEPVLATSSFDSNTGLLYPEVIKGIEERSAAAVPENSTISLSKGIFSGQSLFPQPGNSIFSQAAQPQAPKVLPSTPQSLFGQKPSAPTASKPLFGFQPKVDAQKIDRIATAAYQNITEKVVQLMTKDIAARELKNFKFIKVAQNVTRTQMIQIIDQFTKEICANELASVKQEERSKRVAEFEMRRKEKIRQEAIALKSTQTMQMCTSSVVDEEVWRIASAELQRQKSLQNWAKMTNSKIMNEKVEEMIRRLVADELQQAQEQWRRKVEELCKKLLRARARRMLLKWRDLVLMLKERRLRMQRFPAGRSSLSLAEQVGELSVVSPDRRAAFRVKKNLISEPRLRTIGTQSLPLVSINSISSILKGPQTVAPFLGGNYKVTPDIWRMAFSVPSGDYDLRTWAELCIARGRLSTQGGSTVYFSDGVIMRMELLIGLASTESSYNALALVVKDQKEAAARLEQILCEPPPIPVALLMMGKQTLSSDLESAMQRLSAAGALFHVKTFELLEEPDSATEVQTAFEWLALKSRNSIESYVTTSVVDLVSSVMQVSFWETVLLACGPKTGEQMSALQKNPTLCLEIANSAVEYLAKLVSVKAELNPDEESLLKNSCPALPPHWNQTRFRQNVAKMIGNMKLPNLELDVNSLDSANWQYLLNVLSDFCNELPMEPSQCSLLFSWLSHQILSIGRNCSKDPAQLPWPKLIEDISREFIASLNLYDPLSSSRSTLIVAVSKKQLQSVMSCLWCNKDLLQKIGELCPKQVEDNAQSEKGPETHSVSERRVLENIHNKLQSLLLGLEECKENRCRIEEKIQMNA